MTLHRAVAETLEQRAEGEAHERDAWLAEHYERAHVWKKALQYLVLAAERSQKLFAIRDALHWLDRAVALAESHPDAIDAETLVDLYGRRGAARALAGQTQGAVADIRRVIDDARVRGERGKARDALIQLGMTYRRADDYAQATQCLSEALAESRAMNDEHQAADTLYHLGTVLWSGGRNRGRSAATRKRSRLRRLGSWTWSRCRRTTAAARPQRQPRADGGDRLLRPLDRVRRALSAKRATSPRT
jgi:tetratricopeptide (TPR) repeat protein